MKNRKLIGNLLLTLTAIIWGTAFIFQREGMDDTQPLLFNASRMAIAAVFIGILTLILRSRQPGKNTAGNSNTTGSTDAESANTAGSSDTGSAPDCAGNTGPLRGGLVCGLFLSLASIFQQKGLVYTTAGKAGFITAMYILFVPVISFLFFKKKISRIVWLAVLLGLTGMYLLCMTGGFTLSRGDALVLVCAFLFSGHILSCDHYARRCNPLMLSTIQFTVATVLSLIGSLIWENPSWHQITAATFPIIYCGLVSGGIGYTLQMVAQKMTDPTTASLIMSLESVFAALTGAIFLHEKMQPKELAGCIIMFIAIILVQIPPDRKKSGMHSAPSARSGRSEIR